MRYICTLFAILFFIFLAVTSFASETRGLQIVAKDPVSGKQGIVKFYNKSYAVIIGIDLYQNLPADRQLRNAVRDAKGMEDVLRKKYRFDRMVTLFNEHATKDHIMELLTEDAHLTERIVLTCNWVWSSVSHGSEAASFRFYDGNRSWLHQSVDNLTRVLPVRFDK